MEKEQLEQELEELYKDLEALEKQYNDQSLKQGQADIWSDIKYTKEQIDKIENQIADLTSSKTR